MLSIFPFSFASSSVNLGINDSLVTPPKNIPPIFIDNVCYVPVDVFTQNFIITHSYDDVTKTITLIRGDKTLSFNMRQNIAIDYKNDVYFFSSYFENNTFMVPAELVCDVFDLRYKHLPSINTVRIRLTAANLSDNQFIETYKNIINPPAVDNSNNQNNNNLNYKNIFFMMQNQPNKDTSNNLSTLNTAGIKSTFFATKENIFTYPAVLFDIFISGHSLGIDMTSFNSINTVSAQTLVSYADDTNILFMKILKTKYNALLFSEEQFSLLTQEQITALKNAGYKIWSPDIISQQKNQTLDTANIIYNSTNQISRQSSDIKILIADDQASYNALSSIINYCNNNNSRFYTISITKKP